MKTILALDIGGTKIDCCRIGDDFSVTFLARHSSETPRKGTRRFLEDIKEIIRTHLVPADGGIALSINSAVHRNKILIGSIFGGANVPLAETVEKAFRVPCVIENDVKCMALAEYRFGAMSKAQSFAFINIGTGLAVAYVEEGRLVRGSSNQAGEIGELNRLLGAHGVLGVPAVVSGKGIAAMYRSLSGTLKTPEEIFRSSADDPHIRETLRVFERGLVELLRGIGYFYNPEAVVFSGSVMKSAAPVLSRALALYRKETFAPFRFRKVARSRLRYGACLGAALCWKEVSKQ